MLEDGINTLAFGHYNITLHVVDDDPEPQRVFITQDEAFHRGLGGRPAEREQSTQQQTQTPTRKSKRFEKRKVSGRLQLAMDVADDAIAQFENAGDESETDVEDDACESESERSVVDYDSDTETDGVQGRSTSSRVHPFILSHCTVRKRKRNTNSSTHNVKHYSSSTSLSSSFAAKRKRVQILSESDSD